jgi:hypothetical protein
MDSQKKSAEVKSGSRDATDEPVSAPRKRLAQLIGKLLARTWLYQTTSSSLPPITPSSNDSCCAKA